MTKELRYKSIPVKETPWYLKWPILSRARGIAFLGKIYLREDLCVHFISGDADPETASVLEHEAKHQERGCERGFLKTALLYWLSPTSRASEEFAATEAEMKILKREGLGFDFGKRAKQLSGIHYLWAVPYPKALASLQALWAGI